MNEHYETVIADAIDWTNVQDTALEQATNSIHRIRTLVQSAANGTMNDEDRGAVKSEVISEIQTFVDSLNTSFGGRYVFGGQNTTDAPFKISYDDNGEFSGITYNGETGDKGNLPREISPGVNVELLTDGNELFNFAAGSNISTFFNQVVAALDGNNTEELGGNLLGQADQLLDNTVNMRTEIGAVFNRLESAASRNESETINLKSMLSEKQDVDLAEKIMEYSMEMVAYEASLQMGTRILQTNILNYL